jgi:hypothetical protein
MRPLTRPTPMIPLLDAATATRISGANCLSEEEFMRRRLRQICFSRWDPSLLMQGTLPFLPIFSRLGPGPS